MENPIAVAILLGAAAVLLSSWLLVLQARRSSKNSRIPKGSFGWPLIGETLAFTNADPLIFANPRVKKYGPVFKSHLVGVPSIIVTTPDMARFIYSERSLFRASYPSTIATLIGRKSLSNCEPARHPFLKKCVQSALLPDSLRHEVGRLENLVLNFLNSWVGRTVQTTVEMKEFTLNASIYFIFGLTDFRGSADAQIVVNTYQALSRAFYAIPINLPGFTWYKALKSKERGCEYLRKLIAKSRLDSEEGKPCNSVLRALVDARDENGHTPTDDEIADVMIGTLFGGHDTTATSLTWIIKFLTENPEVLKTIVVHARSPDSSAYLSEIPSTREGEMALANNAWPHLVSKALKVMSGSEAEQQEILKSKEPGKPLTWEDTRKMRYTHQVIQETLRNPTVLQFTARTATEDVEYKGYLIPKGWRVFVMATCIHLDSANYPEPAKFDPSRFKVAPKPGTYFPFAGGAHMCPGNELAKLVMFVFIHHLTTKFRWESLLPEMGKEFKPFPLPVGGYPIKIHPLVEA